MSLAARLVTGAILEGDDAREVLDMAFGDPSLTWLFWVKLAAVYLERGQYAQAQQILDELIDKEEGS